MPLRPEELEKVLKTLANVNRIKLLMALQAPQRVGDIRLPPSIGDRRGSAARAISRQALDHHLRALVELGIVTESGVGRDGERLLVVDHARLYAVVEQLRRLATLRPSVEVANETMSREATQGMVEVEGPAVVLVRGVHEGKVWPLGGGATEWTIGRGAQAPIRLDYDAYASSRHALLARKPEGTFLLDLEGNKNGTFLNWKRMAKGGIAPLRSGDIVGVGSSLLVYRA